jgi:hypothetical protein
VTKRILASPNKFNGSFGKIEQDSILAALRAADPGNKKVKTF